MNLAEVMQLCSLSMRSGRIEYECEGLQGQVFFDQGQALHAVFQDKVGDDAVINMLLKETNESNFFGEEVTSIPKTIHSSSNQLLLESARIIDESRASASSIQDTSKLALMKKFHRLIQITDDEPKIIIDIKKDDLRLGRHEDNPLYLPHHTVSGRHCLFRLRGSLIFVSDLDSTNGTFVNGVLAKDTRLKHGDTLQIGGLLFRYEAATFQDDHTPPPQTPPSRGELNKTAAIPFPPRPQKRPI